MIDRKPAFAAEAAREYHEQRAGRVLIVEPTGKQPEEPKEASQSTVEALIYDLRARGELALRDASNHRRIAELSQRQLKELCARVAKRCPAKPDGVASPVIAQLVALGRR